MPHNPSDGASPHGFTGRRSNRVVVNAEITLRRSGALSYRVRVFDASPLGCKLEFVERPQLEERVWVKFDRLEAIEGIVCWVDGFYAGVGFTAPMHPAVFDALLTRLT